MKNLDHVMLDDNTSSFNVKWSNYVTQDVTDWYQKETQKTAVYPVSLEAEYLFNALASEVGEVCGKRARTYRDWETDRKSTRLNSSHRSLSRMPSSA